MHKLDNKITGAIFDVDGTLLDSMCIWRNIGFDYLKKAGITPSPTIFEEIRELTLEDSAEYFRVKFNIDKPADTVMQEINEMIEDFYFNIAPLKPGADCFLAELEAAGVKIVIATATDRYLIEPALKRNGLLRYIDCIFTCTESGCGKDKPKIYLDALEYLATPIESTYVFEDAYYAIKTAKLAGFSTVGISDRFSSDREAEIRALSNVFITSYKYEETRCFFQ